MSKSVYLVKTARYRSRNRPTRATHKGGKYEEAWMVTRKLWGRILVMLLAMTLLLGGATVAEETRIQRETVNNITGSPLSLYKPYLSYMSLDAWITDGAGGYQLFKENLYGKHGKTRLRLMTVDPMEEMYCFLSKDFLDKCVQSGMYRVDITNGRERSAVTKSYYVDSLMLAFVDDDLGAGNMLRLDLQTGDIERGTVVVDTDARTIVFTAE